MQHVLKNDVNFLGMNFQGLLFCVCVCVCVCVRARMCVFTYANVMSFKGRCRMYGIHSLTEPILVTAQDTLKFNAEINGGKNCMHLLKLQLPEKVTNFQRLLEVHQHWHSLVQSHYSVV